MDKAVFDRAHSSECTLIESSFKESSFPAAILAGSQAQASDFTGANFQFSMLNSVTLNGANHTGCQVNGSAAWDVELDGTNQSGIVITSGGAPRISIDSLELAQFIYLILNHKKIRDTINTLKTKSVLILGRFSAERLSYLHKIKQALSYQGFVPIMFDFPATDKLNMTETVQTLAMLSNFVIVDMSYSSGNDRHSTHNRNS